jgi:hypothetical protein
MTLHLFEKTMEEEKRKEGFEYGREKTWLQKEREKEVEKEDRMRKKREGRGEKQYLGIKSS